MVILMLVSIAALAVAATAQTGSITGTVKDANGGVVPGADVTAANPTVGMNRTATSNDLRHLCIPATPFRVLHHHR